MGNDTLRIRTGTAIWKRIMALTLAVGLFLMLFSCRNENDLSSSSPVISSSSFSSLPVSSEVPSPEPHRYPAEGSFFMDYGEHKEGDPKGARIDLRQKDGYTGILFTIIYDTYEWTFREYTVKSVEENDGIVIIEYTGEIDRFTLTCREDSADVEYYWEDILDPVSGHYVRNDDAIPADEPVPVPEPENDPNTPNGSIDKAISKAARESLELPKDHVLTEDDCSRVTSLDIFDDWLISLNGIEYFTGLKSLYINHSYLTDISPLTKLTGIEEISIGCVYLDTIPDFSGCEGLYHLTIICNVIDDISPVIRIKNLRHLQLNCNLTSIEPLKDMTSLENLILHDNPILDWECISENKALIKALDIDYELTIKTLERAREILDGIITDEMSDLEKELAICLKIHELADYGMEYRSERPYGYQVLMKGIGVCGDFSEAVSLLMNLAGVRCLTAHSDTHAWNVICINGKWYELDCLWDDGTSPIYWQYFNIGRKEMAKDPDHSSDPWVYPFADSPMPKLDYLMMLPAEIIYGE